MKQSLKTRATSCAKVAAPTTPPRSNPVIEIASGVVALGIIVLLAWASPDSVSAQSRTYRAGGNPPTRAALSKQHGRAVIVLDNALLDRVFGCERKRSKASLPPESAVASAAAPDDLPLPLLYPNQAFSEKLGGSTGGAEGMALRFAEQGRRALQTGDARGAVELLQKALAVGADRYEPYFYFYLAKAHALLANFQAAAEFRKVAGAWLDVYPDWNIELNVLEHDDRTASAPKPTAYGVTVRPGEANDYPKS